MDSRSVSATPEGFAQQMEHLARNYHVIGMPELLNAVESGSALPKRAVLITFDDAYADFAVIAWPILKRLGLPATMFVPTAYPNHPERAFWPDKLYQAFAATSQTELSETPLGRLPLGTTEEGRKSLRRLQDYCTTIPDDEMVRLVDWVCCELTGRVLYCGSALNWDQLRRLAQEGLTLGSHTQSHCIMTQVRHDRAWEEIQGSQEDLRREIGNVLPIFCYPNGNHNDKVVSILRHEGIRLAFTTLSGENRLGSVDPLRMRRAVITPRTSEWIFRVRLLRMGVYFDAWRHRALNDILTRGLPQKQPRAV